MKILAWRTGAKGWTAWHVARFGVPLCGTPIPDRVQGFTRREALASDSPKLCQRCREAVLRSATPEVAEAELEGATPEPQ